MEKNMYGILSLLYKSLGFCVCIIYILPNEKSYVKIII